jgi:hypothetical protein
VCVQSPHDGPPTVLIIKLETDLKSFTFQPLKDIAVVIGQTARFECIVQCEPTPLTFWTKNGQTIENDMRHQIEFRNGVCRLTIPQAFQGFINLILIAISSIQLEFHFQMMLESTNASHKTQSEPTPPALN